MTRFLIYDRIESLDQFRRKVTRVLGGLEKAEGKKYYPVEEALLCLEGNREDSIISSDGDKEMSLKLNNALSRLTTRQKLILRLHFYEGLSYEQIADQLSMNYQSVNNLAFRTIRHLRSMLLSVLLLVSIIFS